MKHTEIIECPECGKKQVAEVLHTSPWWTYIHNCNNCNFIITESEWEQSKLPGIDVNILQKAEIDICIDCKGSGAIKVGEGEYQKCPCQNN